jgi:hypothetical protein
MNLCIAVYGIFGLSGNYCVNRTTSNQGMRRKYFFIQIEIAFSLNHKPV